MSFWYFVCVCFAGKSVQMQMQFQVFCLAVWKQAGHIPARAALGPKGLSLWYVHCCASQPSPRKGWVRPSGLLRSSGGHGRQDGAKSVVKTWHISGCLLYLAVGTRSPSRACVPQALWVKSWGRWCGAVGLSCTCLWVMLKWGCEEPLYLAFFFSPFFFFFGAVANPAAQWKIITL